MKEIVKIRHPAVAALLSFISMGLGQLYNGHLRRAVVLYVFEILAIVMAAVSTLLLSSHGILIIYACALIFVGLRIFAVVDAFGGARRIGSAALQRYNRWYVYAVLIAYAVIAPMVVRTVALEPFNIPSGSMRPTLLVGDYLFVSKYAYGYSKYSLPWNIDLFSGRLFGSQPERGDVAVFKLPRDNKTDYIGRIVGLPGDRIQVLDGTLIVNDVPIERRQVENFTFSDVYGRSRSIAQFEEKLPNGVVHYTLDANFNGNFDNTDVYSVPEGHFFAMGDNRDNSLDSRASWGGGFIPAENLVGRAESIFYSTNGDATRFERIGKDIQ